MEYSILKLTLPWENHDSRVASLQELIKCLKSSFDVNGFSEDIVQLETYHKFADLYFNFTNESRTIRFKYILGSNGCGDFQSVIEFCGFNLLEIKAFVLENKDKFNFVEGFRLIERDKTRSNLYQWLRPVPVYEPNTLSEVEREAVENYFISVRFGNYEHSMLDNLDNIARLPELSYAPKEYDIFIIESEAKIPAILYKDVFRDKMLVKIGNEYEEQIFINDWFFSLRILDDKLKEKNCAIVCNGTSKDVIAFGFCLNMGDGSLSYYLGEQEVTGVRKRNKTVDTLEYNPWNEYVSEEVQLSGKFAGRFEFNTKLKNQIREFSPDFINIR
ncbi:hypothetical protein ACE1CD_14085 [Aerosakkonema sp. BLCC-F183]|uniref:hypothetical protein n=1 Tax=Aerosakkonema sp. BLCC-F183 TaxID=3342834 RepID=UPI0035B8C35F